ncbi:hypothetical protein MASR1M65_30080 [Saprospiraceae bacterium]
MCKRFNELHGDRHFGDDKAIVGGLANLDGQTVMILGHQKGTNTKMRQYRNFWSWPILKATARHSG